MPYYLIGPIIAVYVAVALNFLLKRNRRGAERLDMLNEEESRANRARRRDITPEQRVSPDPGALPFTGILREEEAVRRLAALPMIRLTKGMTNNEVKLMFGAQNLGEVARMESNLAEFIRAAIVWAKALVAAGELTDAERVLLETERLGSDFAGTYITLADIYKIKKDDAALNALYGRVSEACFAPGDEETKNIIKSIILRGVK